MSDFKQGDKVSWNASQGKIDGTIVRKVTSDTHIESHQVRASEDEPQYEVKSDETGAHAIHKPDALTKRETSRCKYLQRAFIMLLSVRRYKTSGRRAQAPGVLWTQEPQSLCTN